MGRLETVAYRLLWGVILVLAFMPRAHAAATRFMCSDEAAMSAIAEKVVVDQNQADEVAMPFLESGTCFYFEQDIHIDIIYHGKQFSHEMFTVEVVGFMDGSKQHMFYGLMIIPSAAEQKKASI